MFSVDSCGPDEVRVSSTAMVRVKKKYRCIACEYESPKWLGRCPHCESWESLVEFVESSPLAKQIPTLQCEELEKINPEQAQSRRFNTGMSELNRVLGGGLVSDSFVLLGGDPGIGKSTLLLQLASGIIAKQNDVKVLYISGEESTSQLRERAKRLNIQSHGKIFLVAHTDLDQCLELVHQLEPDLLIMDSLQTFSSQASGGTPGSVGQVREIANRLMVLSKLKHVCTWLVGHVTKEGAIAGPKMVEHMVDTVLYFEGESGQSYRLLRAVKNRFGSSKELGVFEMTSEGLVEVANPSAFFLSERTKNIPGAAICAPMEGTRPLLVECQALVTRSHLAVARRTALGMESTRIAMLAAILEKHLRLKLSEHDLYFNVAGGLKIIDPACDLGALVAILSSMTNTPLLSSAVYIGEVALSSDVRKVSHLDSRIEEVARLGFEVVVLPATVSDSLIKNYQARGVTIYKIRQINELPEILKKMN
jgi:DNA repair protein RadA/Sms